jgi:hypothetical protein
MPKIPEKEKLSETKNIHYGMNYFVNGQSEMWKDIKKIKEKEDRFDSAKEECSLFLLSNLLLLNQMLEKNTNLTPKEFLIAQLNGNSENIKNIYIELIKIKENINIDSSKTELLDKIKNKGNRVVKKLSFIVDEAQVLLKIHQNQYIHITKTKPLWSPFSSAIASIKHNLIF